MIEIKIPDLSKWYSKSKEYLKKSDLKPSNLYKGFKRVLRDTSAEVYICAALGLAIAAGISYKIESGREKTIPLGYSEVKQIENGLNPVTRYLASANDIPMKIFECWNKSHQGMKNSTEAFASELDSIRGSVYSSTEFSESMKNIKEQSDAALEELKDFTNVMNKLGYVNSKFDAAWDDRHIDYYRTETYLDTETHTDSKGNSYTVTVLRTRQVYDYTDHFYDYYPLEGEEASRSLDSLIREQQTLKKVEIKKTPKVSIEGEELIRKSRKKGNSLTEEQILEIANKWNTGSTLAVNLPRIYNSWEQLRVGSDVWRVAKNTAESTSYTTYSSSDAGPEEFQVAETVLSHGTNIYSSTKEFLQGIEYVQKNVPTLEGLIRDYIRTVSYGESGDAKQLRKEIMRVSREWYTTNFKKGLDVHPFREYMVVLSALLGLGLGIAAGFGIDKLGEEFGLWEAKRRY